MFRIFLKKKIRDSILKSGNHNIHVYLQSRYSQTSLIRAPLIRFLWHPNGDPWERNFLVHFLPSNLDTSVSESERIILEPGLAKTRVISLLPSPVGFSGFTRVFLGFVGITGSYDNALPQVQVK